MLVMGIDPGRNGGLGVLDEHGNIQWCRVMPTIADQIDAGFIADLIRALGPYSHIYIEHSSAIAGCRHSGSTFTFGRNFGVLLGVVGAVGCRYTLVKPQAWQKVVWQGAADKLDPKEKSLIAAKRLFPGISFKATEKCKKDHDGLIDAVLIAEYGRRQQ